MSVLPWRGDIGCEGGPVIVANASDFAHWTGSDPLPDSERRELRIWSSFTDELPEAFRPCGPRGHQFIPSATYSGLEQLRDELFAYVVKRWPGTKIDKRFETWIVSRPDGSRLNVQFEPTSEYDRCCRDLERVKVHTFARRRCAIVWSVEPGMVQVARDAAGRLLLAQVQQGADDDEAILRLFDAEVLAQARDRATFDVSPGPLVVAWAPVSATDATEEMLEVDASAAKAGRMLSFASISGCGASLALPAGHYVVRAGTIDDRDWRASWCILAAP